MDELETADEHLKMQIASGSLAILAAMRRASSLVSLAMVGRAQSSPA